MKGSWPAVQWGLLPILLVPVVLSLWRPQGGESFEAFAPVAPDQADYYMRDARMSAMDEAGKLLYQVQADEVVHFPDLSTQLTRVNVHYQNDERGLWRLSALTGRMPPLAADGQEVVELSGGVTITGQRTGTDPRLTRVTTPDAIIQPGKGTLQTRAPVQIREAGIAADAEGMELDIVNDTLALLKNVRVRYVSQPTP
ncbi:MAG: LPS export ABC transporter periplasmic protein LptC [Nevskiales bacterium]